MLIDQIRDAFLDFGVKVFSPYHDIGYGDDVTIAIEDLKGLNKADIVFAVLDGLDSGTFVELGYAMAKEKQIIGYHRTCEDSSLLMLSPSKIKQFKDLTTSIYQTIWNL
jgi:nucleoside 2-deoxyribosyltransferase